MNKVKKIIYFLMVCGFILIPMVKINIHAEETTTQSLQNLIQGKTDEAAKAARFSETTGPNTLFNTIANIVQVIISFLGILFLILIIVSGIQWMTAGGNEDTVKKSKARIKNAIFGLAIVVFSYTLVVFIENIFKYSSQ